MNKTSLTDLMRPKQINPVSLHKSYKTDTYANLVITDGTFIDDFQARLDNMDMLRLVGKALTLGYRDFEVYLSETDTKVLEMLNGNISVNWDIVRKVDESAWTA